MVASGDSKTSPVVVYYSPDCRFELEGYKEGCNNTHHRDSNDEKYLIGVSA